MLSSFRYNDCLRFGANLLMQNYLIETKRLGLRLLEIEDIVYLDELESDPEVKRFFPNGARGRDKTETMIKKFISNYKENGTPCFLLFDLGSGEFIGRAGFGLTESGETEVGYVLHKKFWSKGYASEALTALLSYAKEHINVDDIIAYADTGNIGSTRVMEKCGMVYYKTDMSKNIECRFYRIKNR
jgi:[ribosomal protein S5]-alanine N-acetyltransferase